MTFTLVLGGARSGKSVYAQREAEKLAANTGSELVMIATAQALDQEMRDRIEAHRRSRGPNWRTVEAPLGLPDALSQLKATDIVVVDCLTLWVSNLLLNDSVDCADDLLPAIETHARAIWIVSNEVGMGIVPDNALARRFRDECGRLHQLLAARADVVVLMVAGLPMRVK